MTKLSRRARRILPTLTAIVVAVAYGLLTRLLAGQDAYPNGFLLLSFFLLVPALLGFLSVTLAHADDAASWAYVVFAPWIPTIIGTSIAAAFQLEVWFCILVAMPLFFGLSSLGGFIARILRAKFGKLSPPAILLAVLIPFVVSPIEANTPTSIAIRRVHSEISISAPAEVVWAQITSIPQIEDHERPISLFHILGLPRPIRAEMSCEQVGCVRTGTWEDGLQFEGTITNVTPNTEYWVTLEAILSDIKPSAAPLAQIGGSAFDMVDDGYRIERLGPNESALHLYSSYRVSTPINGYASLWLDVLLRDIQMHLLHIEKARSEQALQ